jgi:hypothetical protein
MGIRKVWLEVTIGNSHMKLSPISSAHRDAMKSYTGLPIPRRELNETLYLEPLQSETGEYQFLEYSFEATAKTFAVQDSRGNIYEHHFAPSVPNKEDLNVL